MTLCAPKIAWRGLLAAFGLALFAPLASAGTGAFTITDDAALNTAVAQARSEYLATRTNGSRLHACLLVRQADGTWKRGSYEGTTNSYPASAVKLPYLAAAMNFARSNGLSYTWLDSAVRPMIEVSDNVQTGVVVDAITGAPNTTSGDFSAWLAKRRYTANYLSGRGLLGSQNILNKTYPSNSGSSVTGYELQALNTYGSNQMQPNLAAELMMEIVGGVIEPNARGYMLDLLEHERFNLQSTLGWGVPPGAEYYNKSGWTSTTLNDISFVRLSNGREFIVAVFTDTYGGADPSPYHNTPLGVFMDLLIEKAGLNAGGAPIVKYDNADANFAVSGTWSTETGDTDKHKANYRWATAGTAATATWALNLPEPGQYEVQMWWPDGTNRTAGAKVSVTHASGTATVTMDQTKRGGLWIPLGTWNFNAGAGSVVVNAATSSTGRVMADAIRLCKVPGTGTVTATIDNGTVGYAETGTWGTSTGTGYYGSNSRWANVGSGATATWTPTLPAARYYDVQAWWVASSNRSAAAKYTVHHNGGSTDVVVNQTQNGGKWVNLGRYAMTPGSNPRVVLTNSAPTGAVVSADAIRFIEGPALPVGPVEVIQDNVTPAFVASANWFASTSTTGYYGANYHSRATGSVSDAATWNVTLTSAGSYTVYARWTADTNRATSAPFVVTHTGGNATVNVNQQINNGAWVQLGTWNFNTGANVVKLSCWTSSGAYVVADAVRFVKN